MERTDQQPQQPTPWEPGVIARYLTAGGATVDLTHLANTLDPPETYATRANCTGCPDSSEHDHHRMAWGRTAQREEHQPDAADNDARTWAQAHAEKCRALPRPEATA